VCGNLRWSSGDFDVVTWQQFLGSGRRARRIGVVGAVVAVCGVVAAVAPWATASAHTETDVVGVPAGSVATVTFEPEHGCGDSPTTQMQVEAPLTGAKALDKAGWTATSTPDGKGNTVMQWSGGSQPAHEQGAFQVQFKVPDTVGTLLAFPAVQHCENGQQLAWIDTSPGAESPAPQLLVLAAGSTPAKTLDDVAADAPGRDKLVAVSEEDEATTVPGGSAPAASSPATAAPVTTAVSSSSGSGGSSTGWIIAVVIVAVVVIAAVVVTIVVRRRRQPPTTT
jgi:uncharacterized protein YcnI